MFDSVAVPELAIPELHVHPKAEREGSGRQKRERGRRVPSWADLTEIKADGKTEATSYICGVVGVLQFFQH